MQEDINLKLSMLLDNELKSKEALQLLEQIQNDSELERKWNRLNITSLAIRSKSKVLHQADFISRVSQAIESEPVDINLPPIHKTSSVNKSVIWALAASIAFMMFIGYKLLPTEAAKPEAVVATTELETGSVDIPITAANINPVNDLIFDDYLMTHNETSYSTGTQGLLPYARVVGYNPEK